LRESKEALDSWHPAKEDFFCWWRPAWHPGATQPTPVLAMHYRLLAQVGVQVEGVRDQSSLRKLGEVFGVVDPQPKVPDRAGHGTSRVVVLTHEFVEELLTAPDQCGAAQEEGDGR
jgi:hypothetical protein